MSDFTEFQTAGPRKSNSPRQESSDTNAPPSFEEFIGLFPRNWRVNPDTYCVFFKDWMPTADVEKFQKLVDDLNESKKFRFHFHLVRRSGYNFIKKDHDGNIIFSINDGDLCLLTSDQLSDYKEVSFPSRMITLTLFISLYLNVWKHMSQYRMMNQHLLRNLNQYLYQHLKVLGLVLCLSLNHLLLTQFVLPKRSTKNSNRNFLFSKRELKKHVKNGRDSTKSTRLTWIHWSLQFSHLRRHLRVNKPNNDGEWSIPNNHISFRLLSLCVQFNK